VAAGTNGLNIINITTQTVINTYTGDVVSVAISSTANIAVIGQAKNGYAILDISTP
jgi:hypothetical protein